MEGIRTNMVPLCASLLQHAVLNLLTGSFLLLPVFIAGLLLSLLFSSTYNGYDYSNLRLTGAHRVGYKSFYSKKFRNDVSVFYPAAEDGSGTRDVKFFSDGLKNIQGLGDAAHLVNANLRYVFDIVYRALLLTIVPVDRDATLGVKKMQPVFFSHGALNSKMCYSSHAMELASLGFCVFTMTHNDGSSEYSPTVGLPDFSKPTHDYQTRNEWLQIRSREVEALVREMFEAGRLKEFGADWAQASFAGKLILMGHSFGGMTMFTSASKLLNLDPYVIVLDPWMFPMHKDESFRLPESVKAVAILTEGHAREL